MRNSKEKKQRYDRDAAKKEDELTEVLGSRSAVLLGATLPEDVEILKVHSKLGERVAERNLKEVETNSTNN